MRLIDADEVFCSDCEEKDQCENVVCDVKSMPTIDPESLRPKPQTNADRLRAMADGELANFLASKFADCQASNAFTEEMPPTATQLSALAHSWYCAWMQWLRQPIKEGADNDA